MPARSVPDPDPADDEIYDAELLPDEPDPAAPTADFAFLLGDLAEPPAPVQPGVPEGADRGRDALDELFVAAPPAPAAPKPADEGPTVFDGRPANEDVVDAEVVPLGRVAARPATVTKPARGNRPAVRITFLRPGQPSPLG
ncbi:MAG: hypothetical protein K2X82_08890 [Gemmataceae bacterium]|nr:hypothetical protein [Gemmataceae bacterium]